MLAELLAELDLARSTYFYHCARLKGSDKYADAHNAMPTCSKAITVACVYMRMRGALSRRQLHVSEKVAQRLMKQ
jgi:putative transposase